MEDGAGSAEGAEAGSQVQARRAPRLGIKSIDYSRAEGARGRLVIRFATTNFRRPFRAWLPTTGTRGGALRACPWLTFFHLLRRLMNGFDLT